MDDKERILKTIAGSMEEGKDFVTEQTPDIVQQLLEWGTISNTISIPMTIF